ncbi:MAG: TonB-dependent receptor [Sphingomicrobium sp.]
MLQPVFGLVSPAVAQPVDLAVKADKPGSDIIVTGRRANVIGVATSASEGQVSREDLADRPIQRVAELLETIPGFIATQHSGGGKANQYFLRGFNLDHGTDFAAFHDGVPLNMRTHGHGQGYLDLAFIIPELVGQLDFAKGPYRADTGDFATAGAGRFTTIDSLDKPFVKAEIGTSGFYRAVAAGSTKLGSGTALLGIETRFDNGPYDLKEKLKLVSGFGKWTGPVAGGTLRASVTAYHVTFMSPEQIPQRAVDSGLISRLGSLDNDLGGETTRIGGVLNYSSDTRSPLTLNAFAHYYKFRLTSNFTYFLDNPVDGDEFEQHDTRVVTGGRAEKRFKVALAGLPTEILLGGETRFDFIDPVSLFRTAARRILTTIRSDKINEGSGALYAEAKVHLTRTVRATVGLRGDVYRFDVKSDLAANSGKSSASLLSPKASLAWAPIEQLELYANYGRGFHSNDARGTSINIDPNTGDAATPVDALVPGTGTEIGVRARPLRGMTLTGTIWQLKLASELLFLGDGGTTEAQGPSTRRGYELSLFYNPADWLTLDAEYTKSQGRLTDLPSGENRIPGAIETVIAGGFVVKFGRASLGARLRHFGSYNLIEDNSVRADPTTVANARLGYRLGKIELAADLLNIFNSKDKEIEYFYASRLPGEPLAGIEDRHFKAVEPRQLRVSALVKF